MRSDYREALTALETMLKDMNVELVRDSDLIAEFRFPNGWQLILSGERYAHGIFLYLVEPLQGCKFHLWLLMRVFSSLTGRSYGEPTLINQVNFIKMEFHIIFYDVEYYNDEYNKFNRLG